MPATRTLTVTIAATLAGGLLLGACGDDTEALSKEDFVAQADAICEATDAELEPIFDQAYEGVDGLDPEDPATQELLIDRFVVATDQAEPVMRQQIDDLRVLAPPDEDRVFIDTMLDDTDAAVTEFVATIAAAADGDETALASLERDEDPFADLNRRAREYGLAACGEEG